MLPLVGCGVSRTAVILHRKPIKEGSARISSAECAHKSRLSLRIANPLGMFFKLLELDLVLLLSRFLLKCEDIVAGYR